ncbi:MAG: DUF2336 domain-containing protein [Xanthobacteraceae bacterium]|jgi:uncharacterized protein (DUF2336 family)
MTTAISLIDDLERALASGDNAHRVDMLSRITDLFFAGASHYSADQINLFDDVIAKLTAAIEPMARAKLAARLAPARNAPAGVVRMLAFDDNIEVARPVLRKSECLNESDLIANANNKSQQHLAAISERKNLSEAVTDVLVTRGDQQVAYSVSKNPSARISYAGFRILLKRSIGDDKLALLVGTRGDVPRQHFLRLIDQASTAVRAKLMAENLGDSSTVAGVVDEISTGLRIDAQKVSAHYAGARASVEALYRAGKLTEAEVRQFATEHRLAETAVALTLLCGVENDVVERALLASGSDILVILAKLAGFSWATAKAILLLKAADRGESEQNLEQAKASFERLRSGTARDVLGFYYSRLIAAE